MKKLPLLVLILLLAGAGILVAWIARTGGPSSDASTASAVESKSAGDRAGANESSALDGDAARDGRVANEKRADAAATMLADEDAPAWDVEKSVWLKGTVHTTCADDGPLEVFALARETDSEALIDAIAQRAKDHKRSKSPRILSKSRVQADGSFRLAFPPDTKKAHVSVLGKYHYLPTSEAIDFAAARDVALTPKCGALISGSVSLPADGDVEDVEGLEVTLASTFDGMRGPLSGAQRVHRTAQVHARAFEFKALPTEGGVQMTIEPKVLAAARARQRDLAVGRATPVEIALRRGGTLRGTVRDSAGEPIAGAKVDAALPGRWFGFDNETIRSTTTSDAGAFELTGVTPGKIVLRASRESYFDSDPMRVELPDRGSMNDVALVLTQGKTVAGTIAWADGVPAANVRIELAFDMSQMYGMGAFNALRGSKGNVQSGADGTFSIRGLGDGPFTLQASIAPDAAHAPVPDPAATATVAPIASGATLASADTADDLDAGSDDPSSAASSDKKKHDASTLWRARVDGVAGGTSNVSLVLRAPEGVAGRVVDEAGQAVAKFSVDAGRLGKGPLASLGQEKKTQRYEDSSGNFVLANLSEGRWKLTATAEGFARSDALEIEIPKRADAQPIVITLVHGASVKGIVHSPTGTPIAGADVAVDNGKPNWQNMLDAGDAPKAKSQPDGTFLIEGLKPGKTALYAKHKDFARSVSQSLDLAPAQHADGADLVLREGGTLTGEIYAESGSPATGMMVQASETKIFDQQMTFSDGRGHFQIEHLEPGSYQIVAMPTGAESSGDDADSKPSDGSAQQGLGDMMSKMKMTMADIKESETTHVVLGAPPADPVHVTGRVTHAGEPYAGAMMSFVREGKGKMGAFRTATVDKDGNYTIKLDEPGNYAVSVQKILGMGQQNAVEFASEIPKEKEYKLDFALPTARISGQVLGPEGDPAPGTRVSLHPETAITAGTMWGGQYSESATDAEGRFDVQALRPGKYTLIVGGMTMGGLFGDQGGFGRQLKGDIHLSEGEWMKGVDFHLKRPGVIDVEVVDDSGSPVSEAALFTRNKDGKLLDRFSMIATDANGKAKYGGLEPGTYFLLARKGTVASLDSAQVRVEEGQHAVAKLVLQAGTMLIVEVFDAENKLSKASLSVQDEEGREVGGMIALSEIMKMFSEGGFSSTEQKVGPLPPGKYRVRATLPDGKTIMKPVTLNGQAERKLSIHIS
jgi:hypothetical protein